MASVLDPEVQLAQRLASNEKPLRTKALKKLRKYINVRSHIGTGGFTGDELLKLWKGLFYCLWMQDKPLLQEELSNQISTLIHSFQDIDGQMLYLETFLQTLNREWTGIDRLRMDKFFQLVRFMFRQTFELLKRKNWDSCDVSRFLELLRVQLLKESSGSPKELQFHILDLYMTELAVVGSEELTADQNLIFIEPFCKTAAKTKDRSLFTAICNSILSTIIEQAPFAIEDLMKEVKAAQDSDSGQSSEEDAEETKTSNLPSKKGKRKQINGNKSDEETGDSDHDDGAELLNLEDSDTVMGDNDIGPVLQFDYAALADKLFELASRTSTPSQNRQRLYKIIKVLRDLSEGIFPQSDYPEEVSTDEDDDMFGSRKRMKRGKGHMEEDEDGASGAKKRKGKKNEASNHHKQTESSGTNDDTPADPTATNEKKKKKKKKARQCESEVGEAVAQAQSTTEEIKGGLGCSHSKEETQKQSSSSPLKVAEAAIPEGQSETLLLTQITVIEEGQQTPCTTGNKNHAETFSNKQQQSETSEFKHGAKEALEEPQTLVGTDSEMLPEADATVSRKKRKRGTKAKLKTNRNTQVNAEAEIMPVSGETDDPTPTKKKKKGLKAKENLEEVEDKSLVNGVSTELDFSSICSEDNSPANRPEKPNHSTTISSRKRGKKNLKADKAQKPKADAQFEAEGAHTEALSFVEKASQNVTIVPPKKKTKKIDTLEDATLEAPPAVDEGTVNPLTQSEYSNTTVEDDRAVTENSQTVEKKAKNKKKLAAAQIGKKDQTQLQVIGTVNTEHLSDGAEVVSSPGKPSNKKRRKISVVFEYEADELEGATLNSGLPEEETLAKKSAKSTSGWGEVSTALRTKKSLKKEKTSEGLTSDFISFKSNHKLPTPLFCKTKGGPITLLYGQKRSQTPKSESKKVTFGLKNNKTAEFRKTDRSLLVSPDGSSRVPFDPKQKPQFGVLKTPPIPRPARKTNRKTSLETPKRRPK